MVATSSRNSIPSVAVNLLPSIIEMRLSTDMSSVIIQITKGKMIIEINLKDHSTTVFTSTLLPFPFPFPFAMIYSDKKILLFQYKYYDERHSFTFLIKCRILFDITLNMTYTTDNRTRYIPKPHTTSITDCGSPITSTNASYQSRH